MLKNTGRTHFKKGHVSWNLGKKHTPEAIEKMRLIKIGKKHSLETKLKMSISQKRIGNIPPSNFGNHHSEITRKKISDSNKNKPKLKLRGRKCHFWKGGLVERNKKIRCSLKYKIWRRKIFERDKYTCVICKKIGHEIHADHIKPFSLYPKLRFRLYNGRTLCRDCHKKTDTYGNKIYQDKEN